MGKGKESAFANPLQGAQFGAVAEKPGYSSPEFKTISAAARPKKRTKNRAPKPILPNENKPFSIDDLFMTNS